MPRRLLAIRSMALVLGWALVCGAAFGQGGIIVLDRASALSVPAPTATPPAGGHEAVRLPHDWTGPAGPASAEPGRPQVVWYRFDFDLPPLPAAAEGQGAAGRLLAAYIPRACSNLEIYLNGRLLHRAGRMSEPITRNCYRSQLVSLPPGLLRGGGNRLDIQVAGYPLERVAARQRAGGLAAVSIGPQELLAPRHESQLFWNVTVAQITAATLSLIGVVMLTLAWARRMSDLLYFGLVSLAWAVISARIWWHDIPLAQHTLEAAIASLFVPLAVCGVLFVLRSCELRRRGLELLLWSQCLVLPAILFGVAPERLFVTAGAIYALLAAEFGLAVLYLMAHAAGTRRRDLLLLSVIFLFAAAVIAAEVAVQLGWLAVPSVLLLHFVVPVLFAALALRLGQTVAQALAQAEGTRQQLEQRIADISSQIERNFSHLAEVRVEQVAEKERKRIAADLHDDLGAKLLTIVHTSTDERISTLAREALEEMRLSVRGIAGKPVHLTDALADWRAETVQRLGDAGIEVEWQGADPPAARTLAARAYVQTTRVLREATSNLIKHSGASRAIVSCTIEEDFQLVIRDNGKGIPLELDGRLDRGHGMASMKHRAKQMHGQCLVESGPGYGTVIRLTLPL